MWNRLIWMASIAALALSCSVSQSRHGATVPAATAGSTAVTVIADVVYGHDHGLALTYDVYHPADANGAAVLFINSGGYESGKFFFYTEEPGGTLRAMTSDELPIELLRQFSFEGLLDAGFTVYDVRHGSSPKFKLDEIVSHVRMAIADVRRHAGRFGVDPDRLGLFGISSGGHLAVYVAATAVQDRGKQAATTPPLDSRVAAVGVFYPAGWDYPSDVKKYPELARGVPALSLPPEQLEALSIKNQLTPEHPPTLVIWGDQDYPFILIPSRKIVETLEQMGVPTRKIVFPGVGHEFCDTDKKYNAAYGAQANAELVRWFSQWLL